MKTTVPTGMHFFTKKLSVVYGACQCCVITEEFKNENTRNNNKFVNYAIQN